MSHIFDSKIFPTKLESSIASSGHAGEVGLSLRLPITAWSSSPGVKRLALRVGLPLNFFYMLIGHSRSICLSRRQDLQILWHRGILI